MRSMKSDKFILILAERNDLHHVPILHNLRGVAGLLVSLTAISGLWRWAGCLPSFLSLVLRHAWFAAQTLLIMFSNYQSYYVGLWDTSFWDKPTWRLFRGGMCTRMVRSFCCWMVTVRPSTSPWFSASAFSSELYASTSSFSLAWSQNSKDTPWAFQLLEEKSFRNAFLVIWSNHIHMLFAPYGVSTTWNLLLLFFAIFLVIFWPGSSKPQYMISGHCQAGSMARHLNLHIAWGWPCASSICTSRRELWLILNVKRQTKGTVARVNRESINHLFTDGQWSMFGAKCLGDPQMVLWSAWPARSGYILKRQEKNKHLDLHKPDLNKLILSMVVPG